MDFYNGIATPVVWCDQLDEAYWIGCLRRGWQAWDGVIGSYVAVVSDG